MQPVTIKNKQYSNSLWVSQFCLLVLTLTLVVMGLINHVWFLVLLPLPVVVLFLNSRTIKQQANLHITMRTNGHLVLINHSNEYISSLIIDPESTVDAQKDDNLSAEVLAFWYIPHILMLKIKANQFKQPIYLTVFRPVLGPQQFSHLMVGLTQLNVSLNASQKK